jgi:cytochrome d ubiquinol oxidase subunit II
VLGFVGTGLALLGLRLDKAWMSFTGSSAATLGIVATVGLSMFPFILPSVSDPGSSLTVWNSSSSHLTLFIMLFVTAIFLPLILIYTSWVYKVLWGRSSTAALATNPDLY